MDPIGEGLIGKHDLRKLRLVSNNLNALVSPVLFEEIYLGFNDVDQQITPDCERCEEVINALAARSSLVFENTKKLRIHTHLSYQAQNNERVARNNNIVEKIFDAISALNDLRIVS